MNRISVHLVTAATLASPHLQLTRTASSGSVPSEAAGIVAVLALIVVLAFMMALTRAARALAELVAPILKVASIMTGTLCTIVISVVLVVAFLVHL